MNPELWKILDDFASETLSIEFESSDMNKLIHEYGKKLEEWAK